MKASRQPGPTGEYPEGKLDPSDQGELAIRIGTLHDNVVIQFGAPVKWFGCGPRNALDLAGAMRKHAIALFRQRDLLIMNDVEYIQTVTELLVKAIENEKPFDERQARRHAYAAISALEATISRMS